MAAVGYDGDQELEHEHRPRWQQLYQRPREIEREEKREKVNSHRIRNPEIDPLPAHSSRRRRLRSLVAESSTATATAGDGRCSCFFPNDGKGSALGDGDTENADPA
ncbi:hypothetical protein Ahy_A04g021341 [Arachis hypogaea]|uniref:Uncharacterized protein n=1 Tax=Arachis hypogaea TaxID=3818 RepID=A0A445DKH1_ARAHY|nr:hypothetical protein Ahy_A04g021341 [Arachis hypogaea]